MSVPLQKPIDQLAIKSNEHRTNVLDSCFHVSRNTWLFVYYVGIMEKRVHTRSFKIKYKHMLLHIIDYKNYRNGHNCPYL